MKVTAFCPILFLCIPKVKAQAKEMDTVTTWQMLAYDGQSVFKGLKYAYSRPFHWESNDFFTVGAIVLGTGALNANDEDSSDVFRNQEDDIPGVIKETGYYLGEPLYNYSINGAVYLLGMFTKNEKIRKTGVILVSSSLTVGLIQCV